MLLLWKLMGLACSLAENAWCGVATGAWGVLLPAPSMVIFAISAAVNAGPIGASPYSKTCFDIGPAEY